jgi:hypothetical protein
MSFSGWTWVSLYQKTICRFVSFIETTCFRELKIEIVFSKKIVEKKKTRAQTQSTHFYPFYEIAFVSFCQFIFFLSVVSFNFVLHFTFLLFCFYDVLLLFNQFLLSFFSFLCNKEAVNASQRNRGKG